MMNGNIVKLVASTPCNCIEDDRSIRRHLGLANKDMTALSKNYCRVPAPVSLQGFNPHMKPMLGQRHLGFS